MRHGAQRPQKPQGLSDGEKGGGGYGGGGWGRLITDIYTYCYTATTSGAGIAQWLERRTRD